MVTLLAAGCATTDPVESPSPTLTPPIDGARTFTGCQFTATEYQLQAGQVRTLPPGYTVVQNGPLVPANIVYYDCDGHGNETSGGEFLLAYVQVNVNQSLRSDRPRHAYVVAAFVDTPSYHDELERAGFRFERAQIVLQVSATQRSITATANGTQVMRIVADIGDSTGTGSTAFPTRWHQGEARPLWVDYDATQFHEQRFPTTASATINHPSLDSWNDQTGSLRGLAYRITSDAINLRPGRL